MRCRRDRGRAEANGAVWPEPNRRADGARGAAARDLRRAALPGPRDHAHAVQQVGDARVPLPDGLLFRAAGHRVLGDLGRKVLWAALRLRPVQVEGESRPNCVTWPSVLTDNHYQSSELGAQFRPTLCIFV